jgi:hypothetical protein
MNGDDGQGFNPGRGGFNHGCGGSILVLVLAMVTALMGCAVIRTRGEVVEARVLEAVGAVKETHVTMCLVGTLCMESLVVLPA